MDSLQRFKFLCASLIILQALDLASTALGLLMGGSEANPIVQRLGWTLPVALKALCVVGLSALPFLIQAVPTEPRRKFLKPANWTFTGLVVLYVIVVASNLAVAA